jgi:hypothetical protein
MSDKAEKDEEAVRMYRRSCEAENGAERASKLTELLTALWVRHGRASLCPDGRGIEDEFAGAGGGGAEGGRFVSVLVLQHR